MCSTTLAVTRVQCHRCQSGIPDGEAVVWANCWCGGETKRCRELYQTEDGGLVFGPGHCKRTPQLFCVNCHPFAPESKRRICVECGRPFYVDSQVTGRRLTCSNACFDSRRAREARMRRAAGRTNRTCLGCGKPLLGKRSDQVFCGAACKQKAHRYAVKHSGVASRDSSPQAARKGAE